MSMTEEGVRHSRNSDDACPIQYVQIVMGNLELNADSFCNLLRVQAENSN
jgi:hypothetical protein